MAEKAFTAALLAFLNAEGLNPYSLAYNRLSWLKIFGFMLNNPLG